MAQPPARHIIVGTAGHVDHGKTTLIKALTGIDTDRLKEEKERGMTIDLGFASLVLPDGQRVGIVDVPGHERFLKNMLAGATGVDVVLLVIAADEGVMPQTREHLDILELLEARTGVVALTKCDVVDHEWIGLVEDDVRAALTGTFLDGARIVRVSGLAGAGVADLAAELARLADGVEERSAAGPFRLPVDRVFTMTGFGTVVTGTLVSGAVGVGDPVQILPQGIASRVRQIQVHGTKDQEASAGTRVAVNLVGVEVSDLDRGSVLVPPGYLRASTRIDTFVRMLSGSPRPLRTRARVRLHIGTAEHIARSAVLGTAEIPSGGQGYVQFISDTPVVAARGDRFVIRSYSPMRTVGGGIVLDPVAVRHRSSDRGIVEALERRRRGEPLDLVEDALLVAAGPLTVKDVSARAGLAEQEARSLSAVLIERGRAVSLEGERLLHPAVFSALSARVVRALEEFHGANPLKAGMAREDARAASARNLDTRAFGAVLLEMERLAQVITSENLVRLPGHEARLSDDERRAADVIQEVYRNSGLSAPTAEEAIERAGPRAREVFHYLVETGTLVKIAEGLYLHRETVERAETVLREHLAGGGRITVSGFRDLTGSSRKYVVPLLEYFDSKRVTRRIGDERVLIGN